MPLFTRCLKCGGWKQVPDDPAAANQLPTGLMMNAPEPPDGKSCTCDTEGDAD